VSTSDKILLCAGRDVPANDAALVIIFASQPVSSDETASAKSEAQTDPTIFKQDNFELPIYGQRLVENSSRQIIFRRGQTNGRPFVRVGFDLFSEIRHLLTTGQPVEHAATPTLERHIAFLRELILSHALPLVEIPPHPAGHDFIVCLTHDVDHVGIRNHRIALDIFCDPPKRGTGFGRQGQPAGETRGQLRRGGSGRHFAAIASGRQRSHRAWPRRLA
jgi:hypothetical protein